jgi:SAM-dependent methyltransferase
VKRRYNETILADVVTAEIPRGIFDLIWCISCIEHFGRDNSAYCREFKIQRDMDRKALHALWEALKDGGCLLVTAPFGRFEDHGWQVNYDDATWGTLLDEAAGRALRTEMFFRHTFGGGWCQVDREQLKYTGYFDQANAGAAGLAVALLEKYSDASGGENCCVAKE